MGCDLVLVNVLKKKIIDSFFEAYEIDKTIAKQQVSLEVGVPILRRFVKDYLREDIRLLDESTFKVLMQKVDALNKRNAEEKERIARKVVVDDEMDERNLKIRLLGEDHDRWHQELVIIQTIMSNKRWFDIEV